VLCSPLYSRLFYGDPAYYAHVAVPVGLYLFERMRNALLRCLARENFMMGLVLRGSLPPGDLPPYLTPAGYETIRSRLDRLRVVDADLVSYLREEAAQPFSRFSLSDVPSFLDRAGFESLFDHVLRRAAPEARVVVRQFLTRHCPSGPLAARIRREPKLEARLALEDRAFAYEFIVGEVLDGAAA
jgi:S-adenosylmethionine:diacylglycerol 3-amino-3-carboxypropyl transferase